MDPSSKNHGPTVTAEAPDLAALLDLIRAGQAEAAAQLHGILSPGVLFLMRRRLDRDNVDRQAQAVLEAAIHSVQTDDSLRPEHLPSKIRQLIQRYCAEQGGSSGVTGGGASREPNVEVAKRVLDGMSMCEREALRRCYVLGEAPESFLETLRLTPQEFRAIRARARAEFSSRKTKTHVA